MFLLELPSLSVWSDLPVMAVKYLPTLIAGANGASATREVYLLWSPHTTMSIRSLAADLRSRIAWPPIDPVTSSIIEISRLVPSSELPPPVSEQLRQICAVALDTSFAQP